MSAGGQAREADGSHGLWPRAEAERTPRWVLLELAKPLSTQARKGVRLRPGGRSTMLGENFSKREGKVAPMEPKLMLELQYALPL